ncbi:MAG: phosphatase PAP2 family protein [Ferruginibacter sp.]
MYTKRFWKGVAVVSGEMLLAMVVFTTILAILVFSIKPFIEQYKQWDLDVFDSIRPMIRPWLNSFMSIITFFGQHQFLIPANLSLIIYFLTVSYKSWFSIRIAAIGLSSLALMFALKLLFMRQRPPDPLLFSADGYSFPSGHAVMSVAFYGLLIYICSFTVHNKILRWIIYIMLALLILCIGFSRIYLRVHYASDVLVGLIVGVLWLLVSLYTLKKIENYNKQHLTV